MNIEQHIRKLARSTYWQNLYSSAKELGNLYLFDNTNNYSGLQVLFLYWLEIYSGLYEEMIKQEYKNLDENLIKDDDRVDALLYYRRKRQEKEISEYQREKKVNTSKLSKKDNVTTFDVDMR